jgi:hypothetical protein
VREIPTLAGTSMEIESIISFRREKGKDKKISGKIPFWKCTHLT